jgi:hypothetical protein
MILFDVMRRVIGMTMQEPVDPSAAARVLHAAKSAKRAARAEADQARFRAKARELCRIAGRAVPDAIKEG